MNVVLAVGSLLVPCALLLALGFFGDRSPTLSRWAAAIFRDEPHRGRL